MASSKFEKFETPIDMLHDELLNMIFNRINFHGHLRLSAVCRRWHNLIQNDVLFMRTVKFNASKLSDCHTLMRSYKYIDLSDCQMERWRKKVAGNLEELFNNAETIDFGCTGCYRNVPLTYILSMCANLEEIINIYNSYEYRRFDLLDFQYPSPVKISSIILGEGCLDLFKVIANCSQLHLIGKPSVELSTKYGAMINSVTISFTSTSLIDHWPRYEKLHLQYLCIRDKPTPSEEMDCIQSFFEKQATSLKTIEIYFMHNEVFLFDSVCTSLTNLETVILTYVTDKIMLNDLKALPKLQRLDLRLAETVREVYYYLDIVELVTLTELRVSSNTLGVMSESGPKLYIASPILPMKAIKKLMLSSFVLDFENLETVASAMPNLKELILDKCTFEYFSYGAEIAAEFNRLIHLESLEATYQCFLDEQCLEKLALPELRHLYMDKNIPRITRTTLDNLADNCPKLLRLFVKLPFSKEKPIIHARRMNSDSKFRRVRKIRKVVDGSPLKIDYDSVESCSDEDMTT